MVTQVACGWVGVGDELQLKNYKAGIASPFEKNSPPEVSRVTTKALRMAFFSSVLVRVRNTLKPFLGFMSGLYRFYK